MEFDYFCCFCFVFFFEISEENYAFNTDVVVVFVRA